MSTPKTVTLQVRRFAHFYCSSVPSYYSHTPEKAIDCMTVETDYSESWHETFPACGKLLAVLPVYVELKNFDPITLEVDCLREEITAIQARAENEINERKGRINNLLAIGYDTPAAPATQDL